jgi:hypothetical protein
MQRAPLFFAQFWSKSHVSCVIHGNPSSDSGADTCSRMYRPTSGYHEGDRHKQKTNRSTQAVVLWVVAPCSLIERYWHVALIQYTACLRKAARNGTTTRSAGHRGQYSEPHECICLYHMLYICFFLSLTSFYLAMVRCRRVIAFDHTQGHTTVGRTPLDEGSARRRDLYVTTHNTHNRQIFMPPAGSEAAIPAGDRPHALYIARPLGSAALYL